MLHPPVWKHPKVLALHLCYHPHNTAKTPFINPLSYTTLFRPLPYFSCNRRLSLALACLQPKFHRTHSARVQLDLTILMCPALISQRGTTISNNNPGVQGRPSNAASTCLEAPKSSGIALVLPPPQYSKNPIYQPSFLHDALPTSPILQLQSPSLLGPCMLATEIPSDPLGS